MCINEDFTFSLSSSGVVLSAVTLLRTVTETLPRFISSYVPTIITKVRLVLQLFILCRLLTTFSFLFVSLHTDVWRRLY